MDERDALRQRYVSGEITLKALAEETGTPLRTLEKWSATEGWKRKKQQFKRRVQRNADKREVNRQGKELAEMREACLSMGRVILKAAKKLEEMEKPEESGKYWRRDVCTMAESVERLAHALNMMGMGMSQEAMERLKLQKRKQDMEEAREKDENAGARITLLPEVEDMLDADMEELTHADAGNATAE